MHGSDCPCLCTHCSHTAFHRHCAPPAGMYIRRFPRAPQPDFHPVTVIVPSLRFDLQMFHIFTCFLFCIVCFAYYIIQNEKRAPEYGISFSSADYRHNSGSLFVIFPKRKPIMRNNVFQMQMPELQLYKTSYCCDSGICCTI